MGRQSVNKKDRREEEQNDTDELYDKQIPEQENYS